MVPTEKQNAVASTAKQKQNPASRIPGAKEESAASESQAEPRRLVSDPVRLFNSWCKGCGICVAFCPTKTLAVSPITGKCIIVLPEACTKCGLCELRCPDFAITVVLDEHHPHDNNA